MEPGINRASSSVSSEYQLSDQDTDGEVAGIVCRSRYCAG